MVELLRHNVGVKMLQLGDVALCPRFEVCFVGRTKLNIGTGGCEVLRILMCAFGHLEYVTRFELQYGRSWKTAEKNILTIRSELSRTQSKVVLLCKSKHGYFLQVNE